MLKYLFLLSVFFGFSFNSFAAPAIALVEVGSAQVVNMLASPIKHPRDQVFLQSKLQIESEVPDLDLPEGLNFQVPENIGEASKFVLAHSYFSAAMPVEKLTNSEFWRFSNLQSILESYELVPSREFKNGTDGTVSAPVGFTFGLAPSTLDCKTQMRFQKNGEGPSRASTSHASWGKPQWTVFQLNTDCNMFFNAVLSVTSIYRLTDGTAGIFTQSFLYVKDSALEKLRKIRLLAGPPEKAIGDKLKEQTVVFVKGLRQYQRGQR